MRKAILLFVFSFTIALFLFFATAQAIAQQTEAAGEMEIGIEQFLGYYFQARSLSDILIVRLAMAEHLFLQEITIVDGELQEGTKTILNNVTETVQSWSGITQITFSEDGGTHWRSNFVEFFPDFPYMGIRYNQRNFSQREHILTRNTNDVITAFNALFSPEGQRRYTGIFAFYRYEIIDIQNTEYPINEDMTNDKIIVQMGDDGYMIASRAGSISGGRFNSAARFFIRDNKKRIWADAANGTFSSGSFSLFYEDTDTIIYEHFFFTSSDDPRYPGSRIEFRIIYRRVIP